MTGSNSHTHSESEGQHPLPLAAVLHPPLPPDKSDAHAQRSAAEFIRYYEPLAASLKEDCWRVGLSAAREWLRLVESPLRPSQEVASLVRIAQANVFRGSGWVSMAAGIRQWAQDLGYDVPTPQEFYDFEAWRRRRRDPRRWWQFWK